MYFAKFRGAQTDFLTAAFEWTTKPEPTAGSSWLSQLLKTTNFNVAIRIAAGGDSTSYLVLLNCSDDNGHDLQETASRVVQSQKQLGLIMPNSADEYDQLVGNLPPFQMGVCHDGFKHAGYPLACDFRLYPILAEMSEKPPVVYQAHLKKYRPSSETERRVRKYITWLDIERPFSDSVRSMQRLLALRLLQPGWAACEYLAVGEVNSLDFWLGQINTNFRETTGRIGFPEAPIEIGDFTDWLTSGLHPLGDAPNCENIPCDGASIYREDLSSILLSTKLLHDPARGRQSTNGIRPPDVFISYATGDYAFASTACTALEQNGIFCWMAPRDINRDIRPYPEAIEEAIRQVRAVVVFVSDTANASVHIPRELDMALERKLAIVPVRLQDLLPAGQLNYLLRTCQWLNAFDRPFQDAIHELLERLHKLAS